MGRLQENVQVPPGLSSLAIDFRIELNDFDENLTLTFSKQKLYKASENSKTSIQENNEIIS